MLDASLAREDQVQEETSTSEQNIDLAESLQNSSNTNLNSQQSPRQDTPTNLSNIELAEKIEDLDFSDDKDQGLTVLDVVDSFQGSVQSSSVCKQTPLPENSRFLNITPCARTANGSEIQSTEAPAMSIRDFSPVLERIQMPSTTLWKGLNKAKEYAPHSSSNVHDVEP